jgi:hypothetical protein
MAWKGLFQHLEGLPMDDYHEFKPNSGGGSTFYSVKQGGENKCWKCGGLHKKKDYPNPLQATTCIHHTCMFF